MPGEVRFFSTSDGVLAPGRTMRLQARAVRLLALALWLRHRDGRDEFSDDELSEHFPGDAQGSIKNAKSELRAALGVRGERGPFSLDGIESDLGRLLALARAGDADGLAAAVATLPQGSRARFLAPKAGSIKLRHEPWARGLVDWVEALPWPPAKLSSPAPEAEQREDFDYSVRLAALEQPLAVGLVEGPFVLAPEDYLALRTSISYRLRVADPPELYYVAVLFSPEDLPAWFDKPNFLLREVVELPRALRRALADAFEPTPETLPGELARVPARDEVRVDSAPLKGSRVLAAAQALLRVEASVGDERLEPALLYIDGEGLSWGFAIGAAAAAAMRAGSADVSVRLDTVMNRHRTAFEVGLVASTRNPVVRFDYSRAPVEEVTAGLSKDLRRLTPKRRTSDGRLTIAVDGLVDAGDFCTFTWSGR